MAHWRYILALILTYMLFGALLNSVGTVILQSIESFNVTKTEASVLEAFKDLPIAAVSFLVASFLPRLGFRRAMILGLGAVALACIAMPLLPAFWTTKLMFAVTGSAFALVKVAAYSSIGLVTETRRGHAGLTNVIEGLFMVGVLSGYWIFAAFINPEDPAALSWLDVYWWLAAAALAAAALIAVTPLDESAAKSTRASALKDFTAMLAMMGRPLVLVFVMSAFLYVLIEQGVGTWLPTFNSQILGLPNAMSIQATSIFAAALAVGRLGAGAVLSRLSWYPVLNACIVAMGVLVLLSLPLTRGFEPDPDMNWSSAPLAAFLLPMIGLFLAPIYPALNSVMLTALPKSEHAAMTGLLVVFSALGGTTGSIVTGVIFDRYDGQTAFYMTLVPMAALLAALALFRHYAGGGEAGPAVTQTRASPPAAGAA